MKNKPKKIETIDQATLKIDYPEGKRSRLTIFFRLILAIPAVFIILIISGMTLSGGTVLLLPLITLVFCKKYPQWWFNWNLEVMRYQARVTAYLFLLTDKYPAIDENQSVHLQLPNPAVQNLNQFLPLVKWILAIPHYIILILLTLIIFLILPIVWVIVLISGKYPKSIFNFVVGVLRWNLRVEAYAILLTTDKYPEFTLD